MAYLLVAKKSTLNLRCACHVTAKLILRGSIWNVKACGLTAFGKIQVNYY